MKKLNLLNDVLVRRCYFGMAIVGALSLGACQPLVIDVDGDQPPPELMMDDAEIVDRPPELELPPEGDDATSETERIYATREAAEAALNNETDESNEITIRGAVLGKQHVRLEGGHTGVIVELQPGGDFIDVLIGTTRFNESHDVDVGIADRVMVSGPIIDTDVTESGRLMLARELIWNDRTIELRDDDGKPLWEE